MKQLFEEEEDIPLRGGKDQAGNVHGMPRPESSEWDLHNHRIAYEEALDKRKKHLEAVEQQKETKKGGRLESPSAFGNGTKIDATAMHGSVPSHGFEMQEDELRDFLMNRIADLKSQGDKKEGEEVV